MELITLLFFLPVVNLQTNPPEGPRETITRIREDGPNRYIAIFVKNQSDNFTIFGNHINRGLSKVHNCSVVSPGREGVCYYEKVHRTATGISGVITFSLGLYTGSYVAVIFSVPFDRISACNWFGVHLVKRHADKVMYDELYSKDYKYTHPDQTSLSVTDGLYKADVTMSHSCTCDMEIVLTGKGGKPVPAVDPVAVGLVPYLANTTAKLMNFDSSIVLQTEIYNDNLEGFVISDTNIEHGAVTVSQGITFPGRSSLQVFEKRGLYGIQGVITLGGHGLDNTLYGITVWVYFYIPYSNLYSNYFGFHISPFTTAAAQGAAEINMFYKKMNGTNRPVIYVPHSMRRFAMVFSPNYIIEGRFISSKITTIPIILIEKDNATSAMLFRLQQGELDHLALCDVTEGKPSCQMFQNANIETLYNTREVYANGTDVIRVFNNFISELHGGPSYILRLTDLRPIDQMGKAVKVTWAETTPD